MYLKVVLNGALLYLGAAFGSTSAQSASPAPTPAFINNATKAPAPGNYKPALADFNSCPRPVYPRSAMREERMGTVTMGFLIGVDGAVLQSKLVKSSGSDDLDLEAVTALGKCRFRPASIDGQPVEKWVDLQYVWLLG